jgi:hypothetical protein
MIIKTLHRTRPLERDANMPAKQKMAKKRNAVFTLFIKRG